MLYSNEPYERVDQSVAWGALPGAIGGTAVLGHMAGISALSRAVTRARLARLDRIAESGPLTLEQQQTRSRLLEKMDSRPLYKTMFGSWKRSGISMLLGSGLGTVAGIGLQAIRNQDYDYNS